MRTVPEASTVAKADAEGFSAIDTISPPAAATAAACAFADVATAGNRDAPIDGACFCCCWPSLTAVSAVEEVASPEAEGSIVEAKKFVCTAAGVDAAAADAAEAEVVVVAFGTAERTLTHSSVKASRTRTVREPSGTTKIKGPAAMSRLWLSAVGTPRAPLAPTAAGPPPRLSSSDGKRDAAAVFAAMALAVGAKAVAKVL